MKFFNSNKYKPLKNISSINSNQIEILRRLDKKPKDTVFSGYIETYCNNIPSLIRDFERLQLVKDADIDACLGALTIPELKNLLKNQGLKVSGKKRELVDRLINGAEADYLDQIYKSHMIYILTPPAKEIVRKYMTAKIVKERQAYSKQKLTEHKAIQKQIGNPQTIRNRTIRLRHLTNIKNCSSARLNKIWENHSFRNKVAIYFDEIGELELAMDMYSDLVEDNTDLLGAYYRLAEIYRNNKNFQNELLVLQKAIYVLKNIVSPENTGRSGAMEKFNNLLAEAEKHISHK